MTIIVTGAAGFIGSNIVKALNARGVTDIVAVDNVDNARSGMLLAAQGATKANGSVTEALIAYLDGRLDVSVRC